MTNTTRLFALPTPVRRHHRLAPRSDWQAPPTPPPRRPTGPGYSYSPQVKAHPAPSATPGWRAHHGAHHIADLNRQMGR